MAYETLTRRLSADQYQALKQALEVGRWPNGQALSEAQKEHCMTAIIHWEAQHLDEQRRTGYIDRGSKAAGQTCSDSTQILTLEGERNDERE